MAFLKVLKNFICDKICLPNVAEFARKHDIFNPIDERILTFNQAFRELTSRDRLIRINVALE
jgi:hypothetical protein